MNRDMRKSAIVHAFSGGTLDRRVQLRQGTAPQLAVRLKGDQALLMEAPGGVLRLSLFRPSGGEAVYLGVREDGTLLVAEWADEGTLGVEHRLIDLRSLAMQGLLDANELAVLAQARSLLFWHERHRFCANCGGQTEFRDGGYRRDCPQCKAQHFPRTDPVAIIAVTGPQGVLLGRGHHFAPGVYSALAGFMEPGESIEEAAQREVFEETGILVQDIAYHSSQPWPFPSSLMIGLIGCWKSGAISIDAAELEDARWFGKWELQDMIADAHANGLKVPKPAAIAHHLIRAAMEGLDTS
jgi:NAD+ diphosphatase